MVRTTNTPPTLRAAKGASTAGLVSKLWTMSGRTSAMISASALIAVQSDQGLTNRLKENRR